jgi:hypothetical protein
MVKHVIHLGTKQNENASVEAADGENTDKQAIPTLHPPPSSEVCNANTTKLHILDVDGNVRTKLSRFILMRPQFAQRLKYSESNLVLIIFFPNG